MKVCIWLHSSQLETPLFSFIHSFSDPRLMQISLTGYQVGSGAAWGSHGEKVEEHKIVGFGHPH